MGEMEHKILNYLEHLWPYISGFFLIMTATLKLWLHERKKVKQRIVTLEKLAENTATKDDLKECSKEKDDQHHEGIKDVLSELQGVRSEISSNNEINSQQHLDIMHEMARLHNK